MFATGGGLFFGSFLSKALYVGGFHLGKIETLPLAGRLEMGRPDWGRAGVIFGAIHHRRGKDPLELLFLLRGGHAGDGGRSGNRGGKRMLPGRVLGGRCASCAESIMCFIMPSCLHARATRGAAQGERLGAVHAESSPRHGGGAATAGAVYAGHGRRK